jgi:hypothetical protein
VKRTPQEKDGSKREKRWGKKGYVLFMFKNYEHHELAVLCDVLRERVLNYC